MIDNVLKYFISSGGILASIISVECDEGLRPFAGRRPVGWKALQGRSRVRRAAPPRIAFGDRGRCDEPGGARRATRREERPDRRGGGDPEEEAFEVAGVSRRSASLRRDGRCRFRTVARRGHG